jgi:O-antigen/teichoic acid export membrane protein
MISREKNLLSLASSNIISRVSRATWLTLNEPLAKYAGQLAGSQYIAAAIGLLTNVIAARMLGPADYGSAALIMTYPTLLWSFVSFKPMSITIRYISGFRATGRSEELISICKLGYTLDLVASIVVFVLIGGTGWWVARYIYNIPDTFWLTIVYGASFPFFSLIGTSQAILTSWEYFHWLSIFQILEKIITFFLILGFLSSGFGASGMIIAIAIGYSASGIIMMIAATYLLYRDGFGYWWSAPISNVASLRKELIAFFGWNYITVTLSGIMGQVPIMLLGRLRGLEDAGFYRLATSLITTGSYVEAALSKVTYPVFSAHWGAGEIEKLRSMIKTWTLRGGIPAGVLLLITIPFFPFILPKVFGPDYSPMVPGVQVMMVGAAIGAVFFWLNPYYYASGRIELWTKIYFVYTAFVIISGWFCVPLWGFLGMAVLITVGKVLFIIWLVKLTSGPKIYKR